VEKEGYIVVMLGDLTILEAARKQYALIVNTKTPAIPELTSGCHTNMVLPPHNMPLPEAVEPPNWLLPEKIQVSIDAGELL
jgi:hypothetical protein